MKVKSVLFGIKEWPVKCVCIRGGQIYYYCADGGIYLLTSNNLSFVAHVNEQVENMSLDSKGYLHLTIPGCKPAIFTTDRDQTFLTHSKTVQFDVEDIPIIATMGSIWRGNPLNFEEDKLLIHFPNGDSTHLPVFASAKNSKTIYSTSCQNGVFYYDPTEGKQFLLINVFKHFSAKVWVPTSIVVDPNEMNLYLTVFGIRSIFRVDIQTGIMYDLEGVALDDRLTSGDQWVNPMNDLICVGFDENGNLLVFDRGHNCLSRIMFFKSSSSRKQQQWTRNRDFNKSKL